MILFVLGTYYYYSNEEDNQTVQATINLSEQPLYQSEQMLTVVYGPSRVPTYKISAAQVRHFDETNNTEFDSPVIIFYDSNHFETWHMQSARALLTNDKWLYLYQDVQLDNLSPDAQLQSIKTDNATVDLTTQFVTSQDPVIIQGAGFYSTGIGLFGDLRQKTANILENVKTHYLAQ